MRASKVGWGDSALSVQVDFGSHDADFELHRHEDVTKIKRELSDFLDLDASTSLLFSTASATPKPAVHNAKKDISHQFLDTPILPPDVPGIEILGPATPPGFLLKCKKCTTKGTVSVSQGSFTIGSRDITSDVLGTASSIVKFLHSGFVKFEITGLAAHIELESSIPAGVPVDLVTISLPVIGLTPFRMYYRLRFFIARVHALKELLVSCSLFSEVHCLITNICLRMYMLTPSPSTEIPGIAAVGPLFKYTIIFGAETQKNMNFTYGFNITAASKQSVVLNIGDIEKSSSNGFSETSLSGLPFESNTETIDLKLSLSLRPQLLLAINLFKGRGNIGAGFFFDIPKLSANISTKEGVNAQCENPQNASKPTSGKRLHIEPEVGLDVGVELELDVDLGPLPLPATTLSHIIFSTPFPLPTACSSLKAGTRSHGAVAATSATVSPKTTTRDPISTTRRSDGTGGQSIAYPSGLIGFNATMPSGRIGSIVATPTPYATIVGLSLSAATSSEGEASAAANPISVPTTCPQAETLPAAYQVVASIVDDLADSFPNLTPLIPAVKGINARTATAYGLPIASSLELDIILPRSLPETTKAVGPGSRGDTTQPSPAVSNSAPGKRGGSRLSGLMKMQSLIGIYSFSFFLL